MINIDVTKLNELEHRTLKRLSEHAKTSAPPKIVEAAEICGCSVSNVSKAVKKAGFVGYKQYIHYLYHGEEPATTTLTEVERLKRVLEDFDGSLVDEFIDIMSRREKIVFFGYGPSLIATQYFEYKLRFCFPSFVSTAPDENSLLSMVDDSTLLVIFTTTGRYRSFEEICNGARSRGGEIVVVSEEFNPRLMEQCDRYFVLSDHKQPEGLRPYEKTRTVFFIFFEQVVQTILGSREESKKTAPGD